MSPAETLFLDAREFASPVERAAFLDRACGPDSPLRAEVESLLRAASGADAYLGSRDGLPPRGDPVPSAVGPGSRLGNYLLASSTDAPDRKQARRLLPDTPEPSQSDGPLPRAASEESGVEVLPLCPHCHRGHLHVIRTLRPRRRFPP